MRPLTDRTRLTDSEGTARVRVSSKIHDKLINKNQGCVFDQAMSSFNVVLSLRQLKDKIINGQPWYGGSGVGKFLSQTYCRESQLRRLTSLSMDICRDLINGDSV